MKKIGFGQMISILANIGVLAGIVVLAYELRQNTIATEIAAAQSVVATITDQVMPLIQDDELASLVLRGLGDPGLTPSESLRLNLLAANQLRAWQSLYFQYERGGLDEALWHTTRMEIANALGGPIRDVWEQRRENYMPAFNAELDSLLEERAEN